MRLTQGTKVGMGGEVRLRRVFGRRPGDRRSLDIVSNMGFVWWMR